MHEKIMGHELDYQQQQIVEDNNKYILVVAGAGSGKTLTILGKIKYLMTKKNIEPSEILCLTFTRTAAKSLENKIRSELRKSIRCYTFHKLAMEILKKAKMSFELTDPNTLEFLIHEFFFTTILKDEKGMEIVLQYLGLNSMKDIKKKYETILNKESKKIEALEKLISEFIHLFKCNNYTLEDFPVFLKKIKNVTNLFSYHKEKNFLLLALNVYLQYQEYLKENRELDFDDIIIQATEALKRNLIKEKIQYIIIDEYQDTSYIRFHLVEELLKLTDAKLMVVGDDFQSIYRFSGCDLSLFLEFSTFFPNAVQKKIETTYRNSQELITIAGSFIMKNKKQIPKKLVSNIHQKNPIIIYYYQKDIKERLKEIIRELSLIKTNTIMILGRNNQDMKKILDKDWKVTGNNNLVYKMVPDIKIIYLTIHKAKGLEADNVIVINLENDILGLPIQLQSENILRLVISDYDKFPYSEERRLFYVALTRTKNKVYLLAPKNKPSTFVKEIKKYCKIVKNKK